MKHALLASLLLLPAACGAGATPDAARTDASADARANPKDALAPHDGDPCVSADPHCAYPACKKDEYCLWTTAPGTESFACLPLPDGCAPGAECEAIGDPGQVVCGTLVVFEGQ